MLKKALVGQAVFFAVAVMSQGIPINSEGVVIEPPHSGQIGPFEFADYPHEGRVHVSVFGKVLLVPLEALSDEPVSIEPVGNVERVEVAGTESNVTA